MFSYLTRIFYTSACKACLKYCERDSWSAIRAAAAGAVILICRGLLIKAGAFAKTGGRLKPIKPDWHKCG